MTPQTAAEYEPHLGSRFVVADVADVADVALRLASVTRLPSYPAAPRAEPFVLVFAGPPEPRLPQGTYVMRHEVLGELEIFLVPVTPAAGEPRYEAVFN